MDAVIGFVIENVGGALPPEPVVDEQDDWLSNGDPDLSCAEEGVQPNTPVEPAEPAELVQPAQPVQPPVGRSFKVAKLEICFCADRYQLINDEQMVALEDGDRIELATHSLRVELHYPQPVALAPQPSLFEAPLAAPVPTLEAAPTTAQNSPFNNSALPTLPNFGQYANTDPLGFLYGNAGGANQPPTNQHAALPNNSHDYPQTITSHFNAPVPVVFPQRQPDLVPDRAPIQSSEGNILRDLGINEELVSLNQQADHEHHRQTTAMQTPLDNIDELLQANQDDLFHQHPRSPSQLDNYQPYVSDFKQALPFGVIDIAIRRNNSNVLGIWR